ncbi:MAG: hypothetical protein BGO95_08600 [Micrococcales bacterium 73-13]|nr:MAG: hypothetical protein BGO95_08600 [Micrococcales bacterium 73-13]
MAEARRRTRGSLTPAQILEGAFALAERVGLDGLSMPELARSLDIPVTSLYWHYRRKDELLRAMAEEALVAQAQLLPAVGTSSSWHAYLEDWFTALRDLYRRHDVLADLIVVRVDLHTDVAERLAAESRQRIADCLVAAGFDARVAARIVGALTVYTHGAVLAERNALRRLGGPVVGEADADFAFGLQTLVRGFERRLRAAR